MRTIELSTDNRAKMARTLATFLKERGQIEIKHSVANQAVAALLGLNEHSLASAIREPGGVILAIDKSTLREDERSIVIPEGSLLTCMSWNPASGSSWRRPSYDLMRDAVGISRSSRVSTGFLTQTGRMKPFAPAAAMPRSGKESIKTTSWETRPETSPHS